MIFTGVSCKLPRVIEKSSKDQPDWVHGISKNYLIAEGVGNNHIEAQNDALRLLKERIVSSIATSINSETSIQISEDLINNIARYHENTYTSTKISVDFLNSLNGISLSKAEDYYWEKKLYSGKTYKVHYHIKYPLSKSELDKLISDWDKMDKGLSAELDKLDKDIDETNSVFDLIQYRDKAKSLIKIFTGVRKTRVQLLELKAEQLLLNLSLEAVSHDRGNILLKLNSMGKDFKMQSEVQFNSTCASLFQSKLIGENDFLNIVYDPDFCYGIEKSNFTIFQNYGEYSLFSSFDIPIPDDEIRFAVSEPIRFRSIGTQFNRETEWYIPVRVFSEKQFIVTKVEIVINQANKSRIRQILTGDDGQSYVLATLNQALHDKGDYIIKFSVKNQMNTNLERLLTQILNDNSLISSSGKIYFRHIGEKTELSIGFEGIRTLEYR